MLLPRRDFPNFISRSVQAAELHDSPDLIDAIEPTETNEIVLDDLPRLFKLGKALNVPKSAPRR